MVKIILQGEKNQINKEFLTDIEKAAEFALKKEGLDDISQDVEISFCVVNKEEIQKLNFEYRDIDKPTDVLSFPQFDDLDEIKAFIKEEKEIPLELGDVVICEDIAFEQAQEYGHSKEREMVYLFTHSLYHLLGYDHIRDDEKSKMREKEEKIMQELNLER